MIAYMNKLTKEEQVRVVACLVEGKLGVIAPVTFPQAANRTLALVHNLAVCCAPMLIWTNKCALGDMASRVSGLHAVTLAQC